LLEERLTDPVDLELPIGKEREGLQPQTGGRRDDGFKKHERK